MPTISMFYGKVIYLFYKDNKQHHLPHIHAVYQDDEAVFGIENSEMIDGSLPVTKRKLVEAWIELHKDELLANWSLAIKGEQVYKIEPLK